MMMVGRRSGTPNADDPPGQAVPRWSWWGICTEWERAGGEVGEQAVEHRHPGLGTVDPRSAQRRRIASQSTRSATTSAVPAIP